MQDQSFRADRASRSGSRILVRVVAAAVILVGLLAVGFVLMRLFLLQERPPIIVKGGSVEFEIVDKGNTSKRKWRPAGGSDYKPDHFWGKDIDTYAVTEVKSSTDCGSATSVVVSYTTDTDSQTFEFVLDDVFFKDEPKLKSGVSLTKIDDYRLRYGVEGMGTVAVTVDGKRCAEGVDKPEFSIQPQ
jgi:hypothetical protein